MKSHLYISDEPATGLSNLEVLCGILIEKPTPVDTWTGDMVDILEEIKKARGLCTKCRKQYEETAGFVAAAINGNSSKSYVYSFVAGQDERLVAV